MDGTLFDTVPANQAAYAVALAPYGVSLSVEDFALHCNGRYYRDFLGELLGGDEAKIDAVHDAPCSTASAKTQLCSPCCRRCAPTITPPSSRPPRAAASRPFSAIFTARTASTCC